MIKLKENIIDRVINRQYKSRNILVDSIEYNLNNILIESGGISKEVVKETDRIKKLISKHLSQVNGRSLNNGIAQCKVSFDDTVFNDTYHFNVSMINYRYYELWRDYHKQYKAKTDAYIDRDKKILSINIFAIEGEIVVQSFENSLHHELQHYFDVEKSGYTWATDDLYKLSLKLINTKKSEVNNNEETEEIVNFIGYLFYISFQGEQQGFANGLYSYLKYSKVPKNSRSVDNFARHDQSFRLLEILRALKNLFLGIIKSEYLNDALEYINQHTNKNFTIDKLCKMCDKVERDFSKKINRAKGEYISPNGVYEIKIPKPNEYRPFIVKNNKIICD